MSTTDNPKVITRDFVVASERVIQSLVLEITSQLIATTPVRTGWAKANWVPSTGAPYEGLGDIGQAQAAQNSGMQNLSSYKLSQGPVFISNNVPYVEKLNAGSSTQAPAGFVEVAMESGIRMHDGRELS